MLMNDLGKNVTVTDFKMQPLPIFGVDESVNDFNKSGMLHKTDSKAKFKNAREMFQLK